MFTLLISNCARGFARTLARCLALATTASFCSFFQISFVDGFYMFHLYSSLKVGKTLKYVPFVHIGWGTVIRTQECRSQSPMPYRLAIGQFNKYILSQIILKLKKKQTFSLLFSSKCVNWIFFCSYFCRYKATYNSK